MKSLSHKVIAIAILFALAIWASDAQFGKVITVTAGTPIRVVTDATKASSIMFQMQHTANGGIGYVYNADPAIACGSGTLVGELAPATTTSPGGSLTFPSNGPATTEQGGFSIGWWCVDGSHSGDGIIVSWSAR